MSGTSQSSRWYVLRTRPRHEKRVRQRLTAKRIECFLPIITRLSQWKDREKKIEQPLFEGYCFAKFHWASRMPVMTDPGVLYGSGNVPQVISDEEIAALKRLMESGIAFEPYGWITEGTQVSVSRGPLAGVQGLLLPDDRPNRLVILLPTMQQAIALQIDPSDVTPL